MTNKKTCTTKGCTTKGCKSNAKRFLKCFHASLLFVAGTILMLGGAFMVKGISAAEMNTIGYQDGTYKVNGVEVAIRDSRDENRDAIIINRNVASKVPTITIGVKNYRDAVKGFLSWIGVRDYKNYFIALQNYNGGEFLTLGIKNFPIANDYKVELKNKDDVIIGVTYLRLLNDTEYKNEKQKILEAQNMTQNDGGHNIGLGLDYVTDDENRDDLQVEFVSLEKVDFSFMNNPNLKTEEIAQTFLELINGALNVFQKNMITFFGVMKATMTQLDDLTLKITAYRDDTEYLKNAVKMNALINEFMAKQLLDENRDDVKAMIGLTQNLRDGSLNLKDTATVKAVNTVQKALNIKHQAPSTNQR